MQTVWDTLPKTGGLCPKMQRMCPSLSLWLPPGISGTCAWKTVDAHCSAPGRRASLVQTDTVWEGFRVWAWAGCEWVGKVRCIISGKISHKAHVGVTASPWTEKTSRSLVWGKVAEWEMVNKRAANDGGDVAKTDSRFWFWHWRLWRAVCSVTKARLLPQKAWFYCCKDTGRRESTEEPPAGGYLKLALSWKVMPVLTGFPLLMPSTGCCPFVRCPSL
jgi:hypothetical protein